MQKLPLCYVCGRPVEAVPYQVRRQHRREINTQLWILSPGIDPRHPEGLCRHSVTCRAGTERWARSLGERRGDRWWAKVYGYRLRRRTEGRAA